MAHKTPRYLVNFGYAMLHKDKQGELPQLLMTMEEVSHWLAILDPLKIEENILKLSAMNKKDKMFLQFLDDKVIKVVKIQRN